MVDCHYAEAMGYCDWSMPYQDYDGSRAHAECRNLAAVRIHYSEGLVDACLAHAPALRVEIITLGRNMQAPQPPFEPADYY